MSEVKLSGVTPYLTINGAKRAIEFYKQAFGAEELHRMDAEDGERLMHACLKINGAHIMMSDYFAEYSNGEYKPPAGVSIHLDVDDADKWWNRAVAAGADVTMPLDDQFWGDRFGQLRDPFGHMWSIGAPIKKS